MKGKLGMPGLQLRQNQKLNSYFLNILLRIRKNNHFLKIETFLKRS
jgi:hypothetical protein